MPAVEFEPTISTGERPKTYALDRAATGTGILSSNKVNYKRYAGHARCKNCTITKHHIRYERKENGHRNSYSMP